MIDQNDKTRKVLKIGGIVLGLVLLYSFFTLFTGGGSQIKRNNLSGISKNEMTTGNMLSAPSSTGDSFSLESSSDSMMPESKIMRNEMVEDTSSEVAGTNAQITDKKVIKNGNLNLRIENIDEAVEKISNVVKEKNGEVFATNFYERVKGQKSGFVTIKVPVAKFEETIKDIKKIATQVLSESTTGQDVTEQYTDLQAQLKNKRAEEESFAKILGSAGKIEDVLAVTREVARVRGEIERLEGRIKFMDSQTDMSTIMVNLTEDTTVIPVNDDWRPWQVVKQALKELVINIQNFSDGVIRFIIVGIPSLIPFALLVGILYWVGKKVFKKISA